MKRTLAAAGLVTIAAFAFGSDIDACGDKSLSAGGIRWQRAVAARYPAAVLAYVPRHSRLPAATRELNLAETLQRVGHTYHEVDSLPALRASIATGQFNIVVGDVSDTNEIQRSLEASRSAAVLLPIAYKLPKAEARDTAKRYPFLINAPERAANYLNTIATAVASRAGKTRKG